MKKRIRYIVLAVVCIALAVLLIDPMATKPWTWANRLSVEDVEEAVLLGDYGSTRHALTEEETEELVRQINRTSRLHFQKNKHLQGPTPTCGIRISMDGEEYNLSYYGIFEMRYGEYLWWIRSERFNSYMDSLLEKYNVEIY